MNFQQVEACRPMPVGQANEFSAMNLQANAYRPDRANYVPHLRSPRLRIWRAPRTRAGSPAEGLLLGGQRTGDAFVYNIDWANQRGL